MKKLIPHVLTFTALLLVSLHFAYADLGPGGCPPGTTPGTLCNPLKNGSSLTDFLTSLVNSVILPIGAVLAVFFFILTGFMYVLARGNSAKIETANRALLYTAIGTAILLGAWTIANVVKGTVSQLTTG